MPPASVIRDPSLAPQGEAKIHWARRHMPILARIQERFERERPLDGVRVALSIHLEAKTAQLARTLHAGGAQLAVTGCNPLSTQDDVAAALADDGTIPVFAQRGVPVAEYKRQLEQTLETQPQLILDDGGDLVRRLHSDRTDLAEGVLGGTEETTTGVRRLEALAREGALAFPMIAVNDARMKHLFDNRYGTGQSVWDGIMRTTNLTIAGRTVVVAGYGWCGRGVAVRADGLGANVVVTEVDPVRAIEAVMDGYRVRAMRDAVREADIVVTTTGCKDVVTREHIDALPDGAVLANAGHFDVEINKDDLAAAAAERYTIRPDVEAFRLADGREVYLLAEGRLVNLAAGDGHPVEIMDTSFALQALALEHLAAHADDYERAVHPVPAGIDRTVAEMKLAAMGVELDELSPEQSAYLANAG